MNGYTKLFASIVHSTIWREPDHVRLVWITLLAMSDKDGEVMASVPGLADAARVTIEQCEDALERLQAPDPYSRTKTADGRRIEVIEGGWRLINHAHYRDLMSREDQRVKARVRQAKHRERQRSQCCHADSVTVTPERDCHKKSRLSRHTDTEADTEADTDHVVDDVRRPAVGVGDVPTWILVARCYASHYRAATGSEAPPAGANGQAWTDVAVWAEAEVASHDVDLGEVIETTMRGFFADGWAASHNWPPRKLAKEPARYAIAAGRRS